MAEAFFLVGDAFDLVSDSSEPLHNRHMPTHSVGSDPLCFLGVRTSNGTQVDRRTWERAGRTTQRVEKVARLSESRESHDSLSRTSPLHDHRLHAPQPLDRLQADEKTSSSGPRSRSVGRSHGALHAAQVFTARAARLLATRSPLFSLSEDEQRHARWIEGRGSVRDARLRESKKSLDSPSRESGTTL